MNNYKEILILYGFTGESLEKLLTKVIIYGIIILGILINQGNSGIMKNKNYIIGALMLFITAFIWGTTFLVQSDAMTEIGPFIFVALRSLVGSLSLIIMYFILNVKKKSKDEIKNELKASLKYGIICGAVLFTGISLQQIGLVRAEPGKAAFISALYILIVPFMELCMGKKLSGRIYICAITAAVGFYFLNVTSDVGFGISIWEIIVVISAICFSTHIVVIERYGKNINTLLLSCVQFLTVAVLAFASVWADKVVFGYDFPSFSLLGKSWFNIIYAGLFSSGIAYTLQIAGQKRMPSTFASLIMSLESVVAALFAWVLFPSEKIYKAQIAGCVIIFISICIAQIPLEKIFRKKVETQDKQES